MIDYPIGTIAHCSTGGYWIKVDMGWQWGGPHGDIFPMPGADVTHFEFPEEQYIEPQICEECNTVIPWFAPSVEILDKGAYHKACAPAKWK